MPRIGSALQELRAIESLAARDTPLARQDPRAKLVATLLFVVTAASFERYVVAGLLPLALFPTVLAARGDIQGRLLARALWLASPLAVMVGLFNPLFDRAPMVELAGIDVSGGWVSFASILVRFALTVSAALVLVAGTGMPMLCAALGRLGVPQSFVTQLLLVYRYAFVLVDEAARMATARRLRAPDQPRPGLSVYTAMVGHLLVRAVDRAQRVHRAMIARGFDGEVLPTRALRWRAADTVFVVGWCAWFALVRSVDLPGSLGAWLAATTA